MDIPHEIPDIDNNIAIREDSPPPEAIPLPALDGVPSLDRSVSTPTASSVSTLSTRSRTSRLSDGATTVVKRRGYMRPQGTAFADSARNRDSVMSLGSIAHMQYYFARTGLLDGKGGQLAKGDRKKSGSEKENVEPAIAGDDFTLSTLTINDGVSNYAVSESGYERSIVDSPTEMADCAWDSTAPQMLPPTVSTYKQKPSYTEPLPDMPVLRRELKEALQDACKVLEESQKQAVPSETQTTDGYYEIQGLHLLDIITLAIRAAKIYYTSHSNHDRLYAIKSERQIRSDLYQVLEILKRMAGRNFKGGMRMNELTGIVTWIESIDKLIKKEEQQEQEESAERESWTWRQGDWTGRERERELLFLRSFDPSSEPLPEWPILVDSTPSTFLQTLQDGQRLVKLHNALVARSKRRFETIKTWHTDVAKPYRMAENLRYWQKAAELRFDLHLSLPIMDVVQGKAWKTFDEAILKWSQGVRAELTDEWHQEELASSNRVQPPEVKIEAEAD
ncbi:hypothetical protein AMS68_001806 [Peltaster fructicola]|uniref:Uncharacterized protein n=1 Tax=Peltaster fructicola TaxID=286661 RepID=A0A6H0XNT4_9PEZI|nr:hypothetical protein AMS68_001806 [Peltaster fructicola]